MFPRMDGYFLEIELNILSYMSHHTLQKGKYVNHRWFILTTEILQTREMMLMNNTFIFNYEYCRDPYHCELELLGDHTYQLISYQTNRNVYYNRDDGRWGLDDRDGVDVIVLVGEFFGFKEGTSVHKVDLMLDVVMKKREKLNYISSKYLNLL